MVLVQTTDFDITITASGTLYALICCYQVRTNIIKNLDKQLLQGVNFIVYYFILLELLSWINATTIVQTIRSRTLPTFPFCVQSVACRYFLYRRQAKSNKISGEFWKIYCGSERIFMRQIRLNENSFYLFSVPHFNFFIKDFTNIIAKFGKQLSLR